MLYAPLRTLINTDSAGRTRLAVDQPSMMYASFADPVITEVGLDRNRQLAELLDALWRRGGPGMLQRGQRRNAGEAAFTSAGAVTVDFGTSYSIDAATNAARVIVAAATLLVIGLSGDAMRAHPRETEYYVLLQLAALGTIILTGAEAIEDAAGEQAIMVTWYAEADWRK